MACRGRDKLEASLAACDDLAAAQLAKGLREINPKIFGKKSFQPWLAGCGRSPCNQSSSGCFKAGATRLTGGKRRWVSSPRTNLKRLRIQPTRRCDHLSRTIPGHLTEALLCVATCAELGPVLRGEKEAVQILFAGAGSDLLDHFYGDGLFTSQWLARLLRPFRS